jgi:hypothetical protein
MASPNKPTGLAFSQKGESNRQSGLPNRQKKFFFFPIQQKLDLLLQNYFAFAENDLTCI